MRCNDKTINKPCKKCIKFVNNFTINFNKWELGMLISICLSKKSTDLRSNDASRYLINFKNGKPDIMHQKPVRSNNFKICVWCSKIKEKACSNDRSGRFQSNISPSGPCLRANWENLGKISKTEILKFKEWDSNYSKAK